MGESDPVLRRIERTAVVWCGALVALALAWRRGRPDVAIGIVGGAVLAGASYWAIRWSVGRLTASVADRAQAIAELADPDHADRGSAGNDARPSRRRMVVPVLVLVLRYALLGLLAYVMISRLRLHPVGLLLGASSVAAAAASEAIRATRS